MPRRAFVSPAAPPGPEAWTPGAAEAIARQSGLSLTATHWLVLCCAREACLSGSRVRDLDALATRSGLAATEIRALFPGDSCALVARLAGLEEPPCEGTA